MLYNTALLYKGSMQMKALIITDNFFEDSELFYPYFRLLEEGFEVDIAALNKGEIKGEYFSKLMPD